MLSMLAAQVSNWEKVTAVFTAVGGISAALAAGAAWLAARSTRDASRDASRALAASLKPQVQLTITDVVGVGTVVARAFVVGPLSPAGLAGVASAARVRLEFRLTSGGHGDSSTSVLEPSASRLGREPPHLNVVIGEPSDEWPPPDGDHVTATVSYSDVQGAARYRQSMSADLHRSDDPGLVSFRNVSEPVEERIEP